MKRKKPLKRTGGLKPGEGMKRSPLAQQSSKRKAETTTRTNLRKEVLERDGYTCQAKHIQEGPECWGPLEVDEIVSRARRPGGHLDPENCQVLCRGHNRYKEDDPEWALRHGLARNSWDV